MMTRRIHLVIFTVALVLAAGMQAATVTWDGGGTDQNWATPENWDTDALPAAGDRAHCDAVPGPIMTTAVGGLERVNVATGGNVGQLTIDGGDLVVPQGGQLVVSTGDGAEGILNMLSGSILTNGHLAVSWRGKATWNMEGGTANIQGPIHMTSKASGDTVINLIGGTITANELIPRLAAAIPDAKALLNVTGGTLRLNGDHMAAVQGFIDEGIIKAYADRTGGSVLVDYNDVFNVTTVKGLHALNPIPADGGLVLPGAQVELSWTLPDPCVPGQSVPVDVYFTDDLQALQDFTDPASMLVVDKQSVTTTSVPITVKKTYYWAVDSYIGGSNDPVFGPIFRFSVDHSAPIVNAGANVVTFLQDGVKTGPLVGAVTDDGEIQPYTVQWTVISEPNSTDAPAVIADPSAEATSITLKAAGTYVLELEANDGEYTSSDTITITAYDEDWATVE